jgi:hypothetical protein
MNGKLRVFTGMFVFSLSLIAGFSARAQDTASQQQPASVLDEPEELTARVRRTLSMVQFLLGQSDAAFKDDCLDGCGVQLWECEKTPRRGCGRQFDKCERYCRLAATLKADLVPQPETGAVLFCKSVDGKLRVAFKVKNEGGVFAPASVAIVNFFAFGTSTPLTIPGLLPGEESALQVVTPPPGCFDSDCEFRISVDVGGGVDESNEGNNNAGGSCIG